MIMATDALLLLAAGRLQLPIWQERDLVDAREGWSGLTREPRRCSCHSRGFRIGLHAPNVTVTFEGTKSWTSRLWLMWCQMCYQKDRNAWVYFWTNSLCGSDAFVCLPACLPDKVTHAVYMRQGTVVR